jgi:hypothetical protein
VLGGFGSDDGGSTGGVGTGSLGGAGGAGGSGVGAGSTVPLGGSPPGGAGGATSSARATGTAMLRTASTSAISARPRSRDRRPGFEVANPGPKECNWCVETPLKSND